MTDVYQDSKFASDHSKVTSSTQNSLQKLFFFIIKKEDMSDELDSQFL